MPILTRCFYEKNGGRTWARTKDPLIKSQLLYQLSYASIHPWQVGSNQPPPGERCLYRIAQRWEEPFLAFRAEI
jgi:hypothetical protein